MRFKRSYYSGLKTFQKVYALVVSFYTIPFCVAMFIFYPPLCGSAEGRAFGGAYYPSDLPCLDKSSLARIRFM